MGEFLKYSFFKILRWITILEYYCLPIIKNFLQILVQNGVFSLFILLKLLILLIIVLLKTYQVFGGTLKYFKVFKNNNRSILLNLYIDILPRISTLVILVYLSMLK